MPKRYRNLDPNHRPASPAAVFRWGIWEPLAGKRKRTPPGRPVAPVAPDLELVHQTGRRPRLTWLGHAGFLLSVGGRHLLVDPVISGRVGLVYRNHVPPPLAPSDWPRIDALLVSHNHYDHLDAQAVRALPSDVPVVVPEGLGRWFERWNPRPVRELPWWRATDVAGVTVTLVPARHWSRRGIFDVNRSHWGGFVVEAGETALYHSGDSAWFDGFAEIGRRFPSLEVAMIAAGAYRPAWFMENNHLNPEQACRAFLDTGARRFVPMHWGSIRLTDETLCEPIERIESWWREHDPGDGRRLVRMAVGETLPLEAA